MKHLSEMILIVNCSDKLIFKHVFLAGQGSLWLFRLQITTEINNQAT